MEKEQTPEEGKMSTLKYYTIMRKSKDPRWIRHEMVGYAKDKGVKPAARVFGATPKTVRKWLKRWQPGSLRGLENRRKVPKNRPSRIDPKQRKLAVQLKGKLKPWGAQRIKRDFSLTISDKAIRKIWKEEGLLKRKRRKHKTKNDLREIRFNGSFVLVKRLDLVDNMP